MNKIDSLQNNSKNQKAKPIMNKFFVLSTLLFSSYANAEGKVRYLNIDGDAVHFSTNEAKTATSPSCAIAETDERFAVSLQTETGRAMYSLLITAMVSKQNITVESAQDCADVSGIERAKSIKIIPTVPTVPTVPTAPTAPTTNAQLALGQANITATSCNDILNEDPSAVDGVYIIDPDYIGPSGSLKVYCDMSKDDGGWTLVMRGNHGDTEGWNTSGYLNIYNSTDPTGGSFKFSDDLINTLVKQGYRIKQDTDDNLVRFFKKNCVYNHTNSQILANNSNCKRSYLRPIEGSVHTGNITRDGYAGLNDMLITSNTTVSLSIATSITYRDAWAIGNNRAGTWSIGNNAKANTYPLPFSTPNYTENASFTMWVR